jgi:two-component system response regulator DegU
MTACPPLTTRERQVLQLAMKGRTTQGIARELAITAETVRTHVANCLGKLGACNRTHAVVMALRCGQLRLEP